MLDHQLALAVQNAPRTPARRPAAMIDENDLAVAVQARTGGRIGNDIGQVKEVLKATLDELAELDRDDVDELLTKHALAD